MGVCNEKYTANDIAKQMNIILLGSDAFWSKRDIIIELIKGGYFDDFLRDSFSEINWQSANASDLDLAYKIVNKAYNDKYKKAKVKLCKALESYDVSFDVINVGRKEKFRYPVELEDNPWDADSDSFELVPRAMIYTCPVKILTKFSRYISQKYIVEFDYNSSWRKIVHVHIHPHHIETYNGRWFLFGYAILRYDGSEKQKKLETGCFPLDRVIESSIKLISGDNFRPAMVDYTTYFDDIVGVSHDTNFPVEDICIKTHTVYDHGRLLTRPLHKSQKEIMPFDCKKGYGCISIRVSYNRELSSTILSYGSGIEVMSPENIRNEIKEEIKNNYNHYFGAES